MEGTIYLKKGLKGSNSDAAEAGKLTQELGEEPENVVGRSDNKDYFKESVARDNSDGNIADVVEDKTGWKPGFLSPGDELVREAQEIAEELPVNKISGSVETKQAVVTDGLANHTYEPGNSNDKVTKSTNVNSLFMEYISKFKKAVIEENRKAANPIYVDEIASKVARVYESVRKIIDWKEEHLMRRAVIERVLKRKFVSKVYGISIVPDVDPAETAEPFVMELVRTGYFENGKIEKDKILNVQKILEKYLYVLNNSIIKNGSGDGSSKKQVKAYTKKKINFYNWVIEMAACEIEETLDPPMREQALLDLMTGCLLERIRILPKDELSEDNVYIQSYIASHKTLFNLDKPIIGYHVLRHKYPEFFNSEEYIPTFAERALEIWKEIESDLEYEKGAEFFRSADKSDAAYLMIGDSMNRMESELSSIDEKVANKEDFLSVVISAYNDRFATLKKRLSKLAIFSTLSIFVAGGASLLIFEIPIAKMIRGYFSPWAIVADLAIPTALMFILVWMIRPPSGNNLDAVKEEVSKIVYKRDVVDVYEVKLRRRIRKVANFIFALIYLAGGAFSLYGIFWVFEIANVPWTSLYINTANVAMVVASAMVIRQRSKEITIVEKANIIEFLLDFFSVPLAKIGAWFSAKWKEYNIVSVFFVALIDFPFSHFLATIEGWRNFIKEKRTELQ
jgi:hypothetical protein